MIVFLQRRQGLIPFGPDYPNSLLIILCQGLRAEHGSGRKQGRRGSIGPTQIGMSIAVNYRAGQENIAPAYRPCMGRIARVEVLDDMAAAEPFWRALETDAAWATPYQRFDLLAAWQRHVGARNGIVPFIVIGFDAAGRPLFLLPLGRKQMGPLSVVGFLGSKHANFNIGLWARDLAAAVGVPDIRDLVARLAGTRDPVDLLVLYSQPLSWDGLANPFALLPHQLSADDGSCLRLDASAGAEAAGEPGHALAASHQGTQAQEARRLRLYPGHGRRRHRSAARHLLRAQGRPHAGARPHQRVRPAGGRRVRARGLPRQRPDGRPLIEIHALEGDGEVLALYGAVVDSYRFSAMFNTYTLSQHSRHSPGLILLQHMIGACAARGVRSFDIGVGRAHYKSFFCKEPEPLFDTFLALTPRGRLAAPAFRAVFAAKRMIKGKPALWAAVQFLRRFRAG